MSRQDLDLATRRTVAVVLAGGRGKRLYELTDHLSKPGLEFGGQYRIIDFTLSNCVNSGIRRIGVMTQYNSHRLLEHLQLAWNLLPERLGEYVHVWPAQQSLDKSAWYSGTADAVYQNLSNVEAMAPEHVLVLAGDHVYKMNYAAFLEDHLQRGADMSIACLEVPREQASSFGVAEVDPDDRIVGFLEKPADPPGLPGRPDRTLASMGVYLFRARFLFSELRRDARDGGSTHDFGSDLIPYLVPRARVLAHRFERSAIRNPLRQEPYWRDVGTLDAYWEANLDLTYVEPALDLYDPSWPIFSHREPLPPAKFVHESPGRTGVAINSVVADGCIVSGASVRQSVLFSRVRVHSRSDLLDTLVLPGADVGEDVRLRRAIVAGGTRVPRGLVVGEDAELDAKRFRRTPSGLTLVTQGMIDALG